MPTAESPIFGQVFAPPSVPALFEWLDINHRRKDAPSRRPYFWRGQADISWPLHSTAYRRVALTRSRPSEEEVRFYETHLLKHARHQGYGVVGGRELSDFELLARLRHHGAATRLVDATRSAAVGLFFAAATNPDAAGALIGLHTHTVGGYERELEARSYDEIMDEAGERTYAITWEPPSVSGRVAAQHSQFLYSAVDDATTGSLSLDLESTGGTIVASISPDVKVAALDTLNRVFDVSVTTLFPDLDGFAWANSAEVHPDAMFRW